jgi:hypothetical protein
LNKNCKFGHASLLAAVVSAFVFFCVTPALALEFDFVERFESGYDLAPEKRTP